MKATVEVITPEIAKAILETNKRNRPLSLHTVERYTADMASGRWKANGQTIVISSEGDLLDGQHRLHAIVRSGEPQSLLVARNVSADVFDTIDNGKARNAGDILAVRGVKSATTVAGAARLAYNYITGGSINVTPGRVVVTDFALAHPYLNEIAALVRQGSGSFPQSPLAAVLFLANEGRRFDEEVVDFLLGVGKGFNLSPSDPRLTLREWERAERIRGRGNGIPTVPAFGAAVRAWNAFSTGKSLSVLKKVDSPIRGMTDIVGFNHKTYLAEVPDLSTRDSTSRGRDPKTGHWLPAGATA